MHKRNTHHQWRPYQGQHCAFVTYNPRRRIWQIQRRSWSESWWSWLWSHLYKKKRAEVIKHSHWLPIYKYLILNWWNSLYQNAKILCPKHQRNSNSAIPVMIECARLCVHPSNPGMYVCVIASAWLQPHGSGLLTYNSCCWICCSWRRRLAHQTPHPEKNRSVWLPRSRPATQTAPASRTKGAAQQLSLEIIAGNSFNRKMKDTCEYRVILQIAAAHMCLI